MPSKSPLLPMVSIDKPGKSNVDLSYISRFSIAPSLLYPVNTTLLAPGDDVRFDISSMIKTLPLLGPLMGSFKVQFDTYFVPIRLYNRQLHDNRTKFDPSQIKYPYFELHQRHFKLVTTDGTVPGVHPTSLYHFLGIPENFTYNNPPVVEGAGDKIRRFNAMPLLGYWDIFRGYYANTQVPNAPYIVSGYGPNPVVASIPLSYFNELRERILSQPNTTPMYIPAAPNSTGNPQVEHGVSAGLFLRTFLPDRFSTWVNAADYETLTEQTKVLIDPGSGFSLDDLRFSSKLNTMLQKTLVSGGRYSDWQKVQYGVSPRDNNELPRFIGSMSTELVFEDVVQTGATTDSDPLGTLGGRGVGYLKPRTIRFYANEHGYMMTILSLIPRVDYYQGVDWHLNLRNMGQLHVPEMDGIGFQDLTHDSFLSATTPVDSNPGEGQYWPAGVLATGKQPAWTEYMTAVNRLHGTFAMPNSTMYMVLARRFAHDSPNAGGNNVSYMSPAEYNYVFADSSISSQNFWVQCRFGIRINRVISKRLMPHL